MTENVTYRGVAVPGYIARNINGGTHGARWFRRGVDSVLDRPAPEPKPAPLFEFSAWPKTTRLFRDITISEKIDGTNAAIHIVENPELPGTYAIQAQSRNRLIYPGKSTDNYGFAAWVSDNAAQLIELLGAGLHFGEWWGQGIGRGYDQSGRNFSLFNTDKHRDLDSAVGGVTVRPVPVLYRGPFSASVIRSALEELSVLGSFAADFPNPEGVCVFHSASRTVYKVTLDGNDAGKWEVRA